MSRTALAFMSYVNLDDQHEQGRLTRFRELLSGEVRMQTGESFDIFQDRKDIAWGQQWQERINQSLDAVTFLIPIITPGFFKSKACRDELERFLKREEELGRGDLILPVYYVKCPVLQDKAKREQDELAQSIAARQYADWWDLRFENFTSSQHRKALAKMAEQIVAALERSEAEAVKTEPEITSCSINDVPEGLQLVIQGDQKEIYAPNDPLSVISALLLCFIIAFLISVLASPSIKVRIIYLIIAIIVTAILGSTGRPLVRIKREYLHILERTPWGKTRGSYIHADAIKNVRVVDFEVVVETDARKHTIGSGLNRDQLEWIKNRILSDVKVQRSGNKE